jgi:hypothetical protein
MGFIELELGGVCLHERGGRIGDAVAHIFLGEVQHRAGQIKRSNIETLPQEVHSKLARSAAQV